MSAAEMVSAMADVEAALERRPGGCLFGSRAAGRVCLWPEAWRQWPSEESFVEHAREQGRACAVQELVEGRGWFCSAMAFPDGTVAEFGGDRVWHSLEDFLGEAAGRSCRLIRWHPAPEAPARMQG